MPENSELTCTREGCHPELDEDCIDGLEIHECPHRKGIVIPFEIEVQNTEISNVGTAVGTFRVHNGDGFTRSEADSFLRKSGARVIAVIGCPDAGKTTAAVMLYELLKRGRLGQFSFVGSKTIRGFQSRSFYSIFSSGLTEPETERTKGSMPVEFLHLSLHSETNENSVTDLLIVDRTGEDFEHCMKQPALCATFPEIERADYHVLLVDGKKLINDDLAALHANEVLRIFLSLIRSKISNLQLVLTKYDKVLISTQRDIGVERFEALTNEVKKRLRSDTAFTVHYLAARPSLSEESEHLLGKGLDELVSIWVARGNAARKFKKNIPILADGRPSDLLLNSMPRSE